MATKGRRPSRGRGRAPAAPAVPEAKHEAKDWSPEDQAEKLLHYVEVKDPALWPLIRAGTHVRYYTQEGKFRPGGFIQYSSMNLMDDTDGKERQAFRMRNGFNERAPGYVAWTVMYDNVSRLYAKPDISTIVIYESVKIAMQGVNTNIGKLASALKQLEGRVIALESARPSSTRSRSIDSARR